MIYHGTYSKEIIVVHPMNNVRNHQCIELCKNADEPTFDVTIDDGNDIYAWTFDMCDNSIYEMVKHTILDVVFECNTMIELCAVLDDVFYDNFNEYIIEDDNCCDGCESCNCIN